MERPTERTADAKDGEEIRRTLVRKFCGTENAFERKDEKNVGTHNGEDASRGVPPPEIPTGVRLRNLLGSLARRVTCASKHWRNVEPVLANNGDNGGTHGTENAFERKDEKNVGTHNGENASRGVPPPEIPIGVPFPGHGIRNIGCLRGEG